MSACAEEPSTSTTSLGRDRFLRLERLPIREQSNVAKYALPLGQACLLWFLENADDAIDAGAHTTFWRALRRDVEAARKAGDDDDGKLAADPVDFSSAVARARALLTDFAAGLVLRRRTRLRAPSFVSGWPDVLMVSMENENEAPTRLLPSSFHAWLYCRFGDLARWSGNVTSAGALYALATEMDNSSADAWNLRAVAALSTQPFPDRLLATYCIFRAMHVPKEGDDDEAAAAAETGSSRVARHNLKRILTDGASKANPNDPLETAFMAQIVKLITGAKCDPATVEKVAHKTTSKPWPASRAAHALIALFALDDYCQVEGVADLDERALDILKLVLAETLFSLAENDAQWWRLVGVAVVQHLEAYSSAADARAVKLQQELELFVQASGLEAMPATPEGLDLFPPLKSLLGAGVD